MQHDTRTPARKVDPNHGLPAGVLGPVALIGPHLLEKEAAVAVRAKNGRGAVSPRAKRETTERHQQKKTDD